MAGNLDRYVAAPDAADQEEAAADEEGHSALVQALEGDLADLFA